MSRAPGVPLLDWRMFVSASRPNILLSWVLMHAVAELHDVICGCLGAPEPACICFATLLADLVSKAGILLHVKSII